MALEWYLALGGVEIANHARLDAYLQSVGSPLTSGGACSCPTFTADLVGDLPYTDPASDEAPWYDPDVPESVDFAGLMVLSVDGLDDYPVRRSSTAAVAGGASIGPARVQPGTITITGILLGSTCCGVDYGLHWLGEALAGCGGGSGCDGDCLTLYNCCPGQEVTAQEFNARHRRTVRRVALAQGPTVTARTGDGCAAGACQAGADILTVEIVLTAGVPWLWTDTAPLLEVPPPADGTDTCVTWCLHSAAGEGCGGGCRLAACPDPAAGCADPMCRPPAPPTADAPGSCFCLPLAVERDCYDLDMSGRPRWAVDAPMITVRAGSADLRNVSITLYERADTDAALTCEEIADAGRCDPAATWTVRYVPAGGALTLDGQIGRAVVECGSSCESSADVYGQTGAPPSWPALDCDRYCLCIESDVSNPPAADAMISVGVSGRGF
jgi:hypothetical protein